MIQNYNYTITAIRKIISEYITKNKLKSLILGVSGGIDSALCAALVEPVCEKLGISLICRSITISTNKPDEILRAKHIGNAFGTDFKEINLTSTYDLLQKNIVEDYKTTSPDDYNFKIRMGNIKARIRMFYLYDLAAKNKGMVLSTDNYTEYLIGFWTLHGDVGDYGMIQNLWKTEVYEMSRYLIKNELDTKKAEALLECVNAVPTDGLGITNSDLDQIQAKTYEEVDQILISYLFKKEKKYENHPVIQRHKSSTYKRNNPYNIPREEIKN